MPKIERDCTISFKVSQEERNLLETRAQNINMNASEFIRFATLSGTSESKSIIGENARLNEKLKKLESKQALNGAPKEEDAAIVLSCNQEQKDMLLKLYGNCFNDGRDPSTQIIHYLIQDAIFPHWTLSGSFIIPAYHFPKSKIKEGVQEIQLSAAFRNYPAENQKVRLEEIEDVFNEFELFTSSEDRINLNEIHDEDVL